MGTTRAVKPLRLSWQIFGAKANELAKEVERELGGRGRPDLIVGIARGGVPVAQVIADRLEIKMDIIRVKSYTGINERGEPAILSGLVDSVGDKRVLVVDDLVDEGHTLAAVVRHIKGEGASDVKTAVLFKKPWTTFEPDFVMAETNRWIVFPWDKGEYKRLSRK
ncbi:MAG: phosphoribosyltransferase domain-containing protein [Candidatus Micrarchaeota archaeon]|nr:phosphoribosyltransferase domain-containing protein [Candidatus Micrarchaeota archaeon]